MPANDKAAVARVTVAFIVLLIVVVACFVGIFTNFGYQACSCNDLRGWFSGTLLAVLGILVPTAKGQLVK